MNPYAAPKAPIDVDTRARDERMALVFGLVSFFLCAPIFAPVAIWKAHRTMKTGPSTSATIAIVLSVLGLCTSLFFWFVTIWQYLAPAERPH